MLMEKPSCIQELKDLTDDDPDFDMAEGGIIGLR